MPSLPRKERYHDLFYMELALFLGQLFLIPGSEFPGQKLHPIQISDELGFTRGIRKIRKFSPFTYIIIEIPTPGYYQYGADKNAPVFPLPDGIDNPLKNIVIWIIVKDTKKSKNREEYTQY